MRPGGCGARWARALALGLPAALCAALVATAPAMADPVAVPSPSTTAAPAPTTDRISGSDRYTTSIALSRKAFPKADSVDTVYLVSGQGYSDALSAGPAAVADGAALLLTRGDRLLDATAAELRRLSPERVVVVGGVGSISEGVAATVRSLAPTVERIDGSDRYATSVALARAAFGTKGAHTAYVVTGRGYADALAAGPAAAADAGPLLLVDGSATSLPPATRELLRDLGVETVTIVGGTGSVSAKVEADLRQSLGTTVLGAEAVTRVAGKDRYATAIALNRSVFPAPEPGDAYVASGTGYADALAVSVLAGRSKRPLYLSTPYCASAPLRSEMTRLGTTRVRLVGGPASLRGLVGRLEPCRSTRDASSLWVVVNKKRPLNPLRYTPSSLVKPAVANINGQSLRSDTAKALARLAAGVRDAGAGRIAMLSGYRSFGYQSSLYGQKVEGAGRAEADRWVARPGYSEHQTGLGTDVSPVGASGCSSSSCIGSTPQGRWIAANAWRYGFVVRYEKGQTGVTGYNPEPWHLRYVGTALARDYREGGWHSLEAYFGLPPAPKY